MRPDIGTQDRFRKKKAPTTYRYDSSLSPALDWDGQRGARELGEWLLACIEEAAALPAPQTFVQPRQFTGADGRVQVTVHSLQEAVDALKRLRAPFLTWTGKGRAALLQRPHAPPLRPRAPLHPRHRRHAGGTPKGQNSSPCSTSSPTRALHRQPGDARLRAPGPLGGAPFEAGEHRQVAVKVIDDRGNELLGLGSYESINDCRLPIGRFNG